MYAVIVGVSHYPHLSGGAGPPAVNSFDLGQLFTSARTARAVFDWLRTEYRRGGQEPVWCQLLLSPSAAERAACQRAVLEADPPFGATVRLVESLGGVVSALAFLMELPELGGRHALEGHNVEVLASFPLAGVGPE